jgi:hypothetical protein
VPSIELSRDDDVLDDDDDDDDDDLIEASHAMSEAITSIVVEMGIHNALKRLRDDDDDVDVDDDDDDDDDDIIDIGLNIEEEGSENNQDLTALALASSSLTTPEESAAAAVVETSISPLPSVVAVGQSIVPDTFCVEEGSDPPSAHMSEVSVDDNGDGDQSERYALQSLAAESSLHCIDRAVKGVIDTLVRHHIEASLKAVEILADHVSRYCIHQSIVSIDQ